MGKLLTREIFLKRAHEVHGDKYDYTNTVYINNRHKIDICCPIHGVFTQWANIHLQGADCPLCAKEKNYKPIYGVGINDYRGTVRHKGVYIRSYAIWASMLARCYDKSYLKREPAYVGCSVCKEWLQFSVFKKWFDNHYVDGYVLDKDVLKPGNKVYSPKNCAFIPVEINRAYERKKRNIVKKYAPGVICYGRKFKAYIHINSKRYDLGTFNSEKEAFNVYKSHKEEYIKSLAEKYKDKIPKKVYDAMCRFRFI